MFLPKKKDSEVAYLGDNLVGLTIDDGDFIMDSQSVIVTIKHDSVQVMHSLPMFLYEGICF